MKWQTVNMKILLRINEQPHILEKRKKKNRENFRKDNI